MDTDVSAQNISGELAARFKQLPKVVQDAINSADIEKHLRELADSHKLHLDQWELLENNVMLTLLGFQQPEELADELQKDLEVSAEIAGSLAEDVSRIVFAPIRAELEKDLGAPEQVPGENEEAGVAAAHKTAPPPIAPTTPPPPEPTERAVRAPISASYNAGEVSHERKVIEGDPYREQLE